MKENEIALKCSENDRSGWNELYERYGNGMKSVCRKYLKNEADIDDTVSESLLKIFENIGRYSEKGSFEGWIMRITRNAAVNRIRENGRITLVSMDDCPDFIEEKPDETESIPLQRYVDEMPGYLKTVFKMRTEEKLKFKEIAERLSISESTAKVYFLRARRRLIKKIEKITEI